MHLFWYKLTADNFKYKKEMASELDHSDSDDDVYSDIDDSDAGASVKSL